MICPKCRQGHLVPALTDAGVEIDRCPDCKGIWLDKGEIYYFTKSPAEVDRELEEAVKGGEPSERKCPRAGENMKAIRLFGGRLTVDYSPATGGIWFDGGELEELASQYGKMFRLRLDPGTRRSEGPPSQRPVLLPPLPNLFIRSAAVLVFLYGLLTLALITLTLYTRLTPLDALVLSVIVTAVFFAFGPPVMDHLLVLWFSTSWVPCEELPAFLQDFISQTCKRHNMKTPRIGIIRDGSPNAFTYGYGPNNARIVLTQGLLDLLKDDEVEAVVAHEIGHARHWDMLIMTAAQLVPIFFYYFYRTLTRRRSRDDKSEGPRLAIAVTSYLLYLVSIYTVLWLSRTREYFADRFAGATTRNPNALASGLVKIGYGLAGKAPEKKEEKEEERRPTLEAMGALGIFDAMSATALAIASIRSPGSARKMGAEIDKEDLKGAMKWDLWNPWAKYYELNSTHPLVAHRIHYLSRQSEALGQEPFIGFDERKPESYWDEFLVDLFIRFLPALAFLSLLGGFLFTGRTWWIGIAVCAAGIGSLVKTHISYPSTFFPEMTVASLLKKVKVSPVRPVPCKVKGTIIGRGIPGLIWSEDFVMQDSTGIIFLDYHQPIPMWDFVFGLLGRAHFENREAEIIGWYRRSPVPYVEIRSIRAEGESETTRCHTFLGKRLGAVAMIFLGLLAAFVLNWLQPVVLWDVRLWDFIL